MSIIIPQPVADIYQTLIENNFPTYLVGGSVRNIMLGKPVKDWDMTTLATPEEMLKLFPDAFYDNQFGTIGVPIEDKTIVEITTFRTERDYKDSRHPTEVTWGKTIEEDLERRDFTMNAIALQIPLSALEK